MALDAGRGEEALLVIAAVVAVAGLLNLRPAADPATRPAQGDHQPLTNRLERQNTPPHA